MAKTKFRPLHDQVVVKCIEAEQKTKGGIIIPDSAKEKPQEGEVVAVGPGGRDEAGKLIPIDIQTGDKVLFGRWSGTEIRIDGEELLIMKGVRHHGRAELACLSAILDGVRLPREKKWGSEQAAPIFLFIAARRLRNAGQKKLLIGCVSCAGAFKALLESALNFPLVKLLLQSSARVQSIRIRASRQAAISRFRR